MAGSRWPETPVVITTPPTEGVERFEGVWTWSGRMKTHPADAAPPAVCDTGGMQTFAEALEAHVPSEAWVERIADRVAAKLVAKLADQDPGHAVEVGAGHRIEAQSPR